MTTENKNIQYKEYYDHKKRSCLSSVEICNHQLNTNPQLAIIIQIYMEQLEGLASLSSEYLVSQLKKSLYDLK